jgi:hypothetical protein
MVMAGIGHRVGAGAGDACAVRRRSAGGLSPLRAAGADARTGTRLAPQFSPRGCAARLGPRAARGAYFAGRCESKCTILEIATPQQRQQPFGLGNLRRDQTRRKPLVRPLRVERKGSKKCGLHLQNIERTYALLPRQPNYDLLDPDRAQRLGEIGIANDLTRKVELLAGDDVGIMRRFDQRFDYRQERPILRRKVAANGDDRAAYVDAVGIVRSWMRMAGMIEIVKQRRNQQVADLPRGKTV